MKVLNALEMQTLDRIVIQDIGIPAEVLMERAGLGVAENIFDYYPKSRFEKVLVVCGPGNNGGDGMVCARYLWDKGYQVKLILLSDKEKYKGEALKNLKILEKLDLSIEIIKDITIFIKHLFDLSPDIIVDAIFGTGLKRKIEGLLAEVIQEINLYKENSQAKVVAVDIPSGICSNTGQVLGIAIKADLTVTFEFPKIGHYFYPGKEHTGELKIVSIGFPRSIIEEREPKREFIDVDWFEKVFRPRKGYTHKGTFGHVLVLAGSKGKSGAGLLCALGALRGGAGLVTLASTESLQKIYSSILPEVLTSGLEENERGEIAYSNLQKILKLCENKSVIVIGPGLGLSEEIKRLFFELLLELDIPVVIDADGLTLLSENPEFLKSYRGVKVLTPHPGEAERLLKVSKKEILRDRLGYAQRLSELTGAIVVLKGPHSIIFTPDGRCGISSIDEPGLSQGGTGDVLSGLIGAFIAQKYDPFEATCLAVFLHGKAGNLLAKEKGPFGFIATEVANTVPLVLREIKNAKY